MLSDRELTGIISEKLERALNASDGGLSQRRRDLFDRYFGARDGNERDGYSKFTTREVLEAVEWALPSLIRIFYGSDKVVSFDPVGNEDEGAAEQETDACTFVVTKANRGDSFEAIYSFIKDALMSPTAYAKVYAEEEERSFVRRESELLPDQVAKLTESPNIELIEQKSRQIQVEVPTQDQQGQPVMAVQDIEVFDVRYRETDDRPRVRIIPVPGEEVLIDNNFTALNLDNAPFVAHRVRKHKSELLRMGYSEDEIESVGGFGSDAEFNDERTHRLFYEDENPDGDQDEPDESMAPYWCHECYLWIDADEDGIAEYRKIFLIGTKIFENEEVDYQPMIAMSSTIVPHKHAGMSVAEMVEDQQQLLTTLMRNLLDNAYALARNRRVISEDSLLEDGATMDALLNPVADYVPVRGDAAAAVAYENRPNAIGDLMGVIQHTQSRTSMRTGVSPENSVDPDVLQTAKTGAFMSALDKAGERIELIARVMAETGIKQMFRKAHTLIRTYPDISRTVKLRGEWIPIDSQSWRERIDMTANVGLGTSNKQFQIALLKDVLTYQTEVAEPRGLATPQQIFNTLEQLIEAGDVGASERYFMSPARPEYKPPEPPPPDPVAMAQAKLFESQSQAVIMEQQRKGQEAQAKTQMDGARLQMDGQKSQAEIQLKDAELQHKTKELQFKQSEAQQRAESDAAKTAETEAREENLDADSDLKEAQKIKTLADAEKSLTDAAVAEKLSNRPPDTNGGGQGDKP